MTAAHHRLRVDSQPLVWATGRGDSEGRQGVVPGIKNTRLQHPAASLWAKPMERTAKAIFIRSFQEGC